MSSSLPYVCFECGAEYAGEDAADGCCKAPTSNDPPRQRIEAFIRGRDRFVLEGETCDAWIMTDAPVENKQ